MRNGSQRPYSLKPKGHKEAGFTLLELLIVIAILGLLVALAGPPVYRYLTRAKADVASIQINELEAAIDLFRLDVGRPPSKSEGLTALVRKPDGLARWRGPYLNKERGIIDPWGNPYRYRIPGGSAEYEIVSFGSDNAEGGDNEARDISNVATGGN